MKLQTIETSAKEIERVMIGAVSSTSLWLAPIVPAVMTFYSLRDRLGFAPMWAFTSALVVEFFDVTSMDTLMSIRKYNHLRIKEAPPQSPLYAWIAFSTYVVIILAVNVILEAVSGAHWTIVLSKFLLCLFSPIASLLLSVRGQLADLIEEYPLDRVGRRLKRESDNVRLSAGLSELGIDSKRNGRTQSASVSDTVRQGSGRVRHKTDTVGQVSDSVATYEDYVRQCPDNDMTRSQIVSRFGVTDRTAYRWIKRAGKGKK